MRTKTTLAVRLVTRVTRVTRVDSPKTLFSDMGSLRDSPNGTIGNFTNGTIGNPGQVGLGSSRPESTRPGQLGRVKSALYIRHSCVLLDRESCSK